MNDIIASLKNVSRSFEQGDVTINVLRGVDLEIQSGELVALLGPSGTGKSTLLQALGLLEGGFGGNIIIDGEEAGNLGKDRLTEIRREKLGFVYQFHHLLPEFSALENIVLPQLANGVAEAEAKDRALKLLDRVGVSSRAGHRPAALSGGEQQRVAYCRALANEPRLLLADEPTGNLDPATSDQVFDAMMQLVAETGLSAVIATHNMDLAARMDRVLRLENGQLVSA